MKKWKACMLAFSIAGCSCISTLLSFFGWNQILVDAQEISSDNSMICTNDNKYFNVNNGKLLSVTEAFHELDCVSIMVDDAISEIDAGAFTECTNLIEVTFDESSTDMVIGYGAFYCCSNLQSFDFAPVISIDEYAFAGCTQLQTANLTNPRFAGIGEKAFYDCYSLSEITIAIHDTNKTNFIGTDAFSYDMSSSMERVPHTLSLILDNSTEYALPEAFFINDSMLTSVSVSGEGLLSISYGAFYCCSNLQSFDFDQVIAVNEYAFAGCRQLQTANLTNSQFAGIGEKAFYDCYSLSEITIAIHDTNKTNFIGTDAFSYDMSSSMERVPHTLSLILDNSTEYALPEAFFINDSMLTSVSVSGEGLLSISYGAFYCCSNLQSFDFDQVISVDGLAFAGCTQLQKAYFENRQLSKIEDNAFKDCSSLTIYGYLDSPSSIYATEYGIAFVPLERITTTTSTSDSVLYGDINLDGRVELSDAVLLNKATAGSVQLNTLAIKNADCNNDSVMSAEDSLTLLRFLVHLITSLPEIA